jgi:hypothetical protein
LLLPLTAGAAPQQAANKAAAANVESFFIISPRTSVRAGVNGSQTIWHRTGIADARSTVLLGPHRKILRV